MSIDIKDKIIELSSNPKLKCVLLRINYNKTEDYDRKHYYIVENLEEWYSIFNKKSTSYDMEVSKEGLLDMCTLFIDKFLNGEDVVFRCVRNYLYPEQITIPYHKNCEDKNMDLFTFSKRMNEIMDCSESQHFCFRLDSKNAGLHGYVHGYEALSEFTNIIASNLKNTRVKIKYGNYM